MYNDIVCGDALDELKKLKNDSIDLIATDPPYGYSFMGKDWDRAVPSVEIWKECLRVLKAGSFCFVMSAPRSDVQNAMISRLMEAGFRLDFTPIYWTYASGFPKAGNIGKLVDKRLGVEQEKTGVIRTDGSGSGEIRTASERERQLETVFEETRATSQQAKALDGSYAGFQPKPAVEVIIVAMKPLSEKTFVDQALKNGKGITWLDDVRIPIAEQGEDKRLGGKGQWNIKRVSSGDTVSLPAMTNTSHEQGRFPANLLVSDDVLNDGVVRHKAGNKKSMPNRKTINNSVGQYLSDYSHSGTHNPDYYGDSGTYSRYFDLDKWASTLPFLIVPKASKSEKNKGLENLPTHTGNLSSMTTRGERERGESRDVAEFKNHHPTVKPLKLMSYLITLGSRKGDTVLDPFVGSGTTCLAAKQLGRDYIGIDRELDYVEIAKSRIKQEVQGTLL